MYRKKPTLKRLSKVLNDQASERRSLKKYRTYHGTDHELAVKLDKIYREESDRANQRKREELQWLTGKPY